MRKLLAITAATALMASFGTAYAQDYYMNRDQAGAWRVYGGSNAEGNPVMEGQYDAAPGDCPAGSYYRNSGDYLVECGTTNQLGARQEQAGAMANGQAYPQGSVQLQPNGMPIGKAGDSDTAGHGASSGSSNQ